MHVGGLEATAFFSKWKKVTKQKYDKNDDLFHELQAFVIQYVEEGFTHDRGKREVMGLGGLVLKVFLGLGGLAGGANGLLNAKQR